MIKLIIGTTVLMLSLVLYKTKPTEAASATPRVSAIAPSASTQPVTTLSPTLANTQTDASFTRLIKSSRKPIPEHDTRVLFIGDSLAAGLKNPLQQFFEKSNASFDAINQDGKSITSFTSKKGAMRDVFTQALTKRPDIVVICLGTNDSYGDVTSMPTVIRSIQIMNHELRKIGARIYWIGPPTLGRYCGKRKDGTIFCHDPHSPVAPLLKQVYQERYFDSRQLEMKRWDGLHPTGPEFNRWSTEIIAWISAKT